MDIRQALEDDVGDLADLGETSTSAVQLLIQSRTVVVADAEDGVVGFVSYDVFDSAVHVTRLAGPPVARDRLIAAPIEFARAESLPVELIVPRESDTDRTADRHDFVEVGPGPQFEGEATVRYRLEVP